MLGLREEFDLANAAAAKLDIVSVDRDFAAAGIPAFRLVSGFNRPESNLRYVLLGEDTRDKVTEAEMQQAARLTAAILMKALSAEDVDLRS